MTQIAAAPRPVWAFAEHEHRDLVRGLNRIHETACEVQGWVAPELPTHLVGVIDWFDHVLAPHLSWEEAWLFPEIDRANRDSVVDATGPIDHQQIRSMVDGSVRTAPCCRRSMLPHGCPRSSATCSGSRRSCARTSSARNGSSSRSSQSERHDGSRLPSRAHIRASRRVSRTGRPRLPGAFGSARSARARLPAGGDPLDSDAASLRSRADRVLGDRLRSWAAIGADPR